MISSRFRFITLQQLEALVCLVEERSFSRAAKKMSLTQPSLSKHIRNLETFTDSTLIMRTKAGISLSDEGAILYGYARRILKLRDEAKDKLLLSKESVSGLVFAGASTIPATYILPSVLTALRGSHPDIMVHLSPGDSDSVIHMVLAGQVEIGFIGKPVQDRRVFSERIWDDELVLVTKNDLRGKPYREVSVAEIASLPFVIREKGSGTMSMLEEYLKEHHNTSLARFSIVGEMGSSEAVKEAVISGLGLSILSIHAVKREIEQGILIRIPIRGPRIVRSIYMIRKKQFTPLLQHSIFMDTAKAHQPCITPGIP
ncbi:MAG TPA: selenium metabolism-associated LysR family transcriptional regulator [Deltaproteobacteria bacterium]|nr:selenium metabolism-associated LysR family transcriptional regulator [Deltaproteobacteria bacterium]